MKDNALRDCRIKNVLRHSFGVTTIKLESEEAGRSLVGLQQWKLWGFAASDRSVSACAKGI